MPAPDAISCDKLAKLVGTPKAPLILDARRDAARTKDRRALPAALDLPEDATTPARLHALPADLAGRSVVVVCAEGHGRSQGVAAWLRSEGVAAEYLDGGHAAWVGANLPTYDPAQLPRRDASGRSLWVTRLRRKIDRIACPWLIRRFIDPKARFLFVAPSAVTSVAEATGAAPFDIEGAAFSHRGEGCTFDTLIAEFGLRLPALDRLATIVRGADTARPDLAPEATGLLAISLGLSRVHSDDQAQLDAGLALYDALYRWARDTTAEVHIWPTSSPRRA